MSTAPAEASVAAPQLLDLRSAVMEIRQACRELGGEPEGTDAEVHETEAHRSPFFFITGAGISFPPVPLAASVIEHCKLVAQSYERTGKPEGNAVLDAYSHWFARAYPGARQRQQYLRSLIEGKPLSLASLRLAHLLSARRVSNLVVTTNFDDFVARGLRLFGTEPAVCDHPRTVGRIDRERADVQIVHVHGSYLFYDCANLRGEVTDRARADEESSFTMMGLLDSLLWNRSPLVVGYSGWEGDVIMSALRRRLRGGNPLAHSLYWFCYRRDELERLPDWLRGSPDVRFVVPDAPAPEPAATPQAAMRGSSGAAPARRTGSSDPTQQAPSQPTLSAFQVFDALKVAFGVGDAELFVNPIESFAHSLQSALPGSDGAAGDPYAFKALIDSLHEAAREFRVGRNRKPAGHEAALERLRPLLRQSRYREALRQLAQIVPAQMTRLGIPERAEVKAAGQLIARTLYGKQGNPFAETSAGPDAADATPADDDAPAQALVFDAALERSLGPLPAGVVWLMGSHSGHHGMEVTIRGKAHGAFTFHFGEALTDAACDADRDGIVSLLEAAVEANRRMRRAGTPQLAALEGEGERVGLFEAVRGSGSSRAERHRGKLLALLVGVSQFPWGGVLNGPANDLQRLQRVLTQRERSLHASARVLTLLDGEATMAAVGQRLKSLCDEAGPDDTLLFHYSGMGWRRDEPPAAATAEGTTTRPAGQTIAIVLHDYDERTSAGVVTQRHLLDALRTSAAGHRIVLLDF